VTAQLEYFVNQQYSTVNYSKFICTLSSLKLNGEDTGSIECIAYNYQFVPASTIGVSHRDLKNSVLHSLLHLLKLPCSLISLLHSLLLDAMDSYLPMQWLAQSVHCLGIRFRNFVYCRTSTWSSNSSTTNLYT